MEALLRYFEARPARVVLLWLWTLIIPGVVLSRTLPWPYSESIDDFVKFTTLLGYPQLIIFGLPEPALSRPFQWIARASFALQVAVVVVSLFSTPGPASPVEGVLGQLLGAVGGVLIVSPLFLATSALGAARRRLGLYKPFDFVGTFVALAYLPLGGLVPLRRLLRPVLEGSRPSTRTTVIEDRADSS
ncbi:MAG: hypothetical protein JSR73_19360 [Proteobacteria bacterium]|nr:hypothetical protein [Pseudomonadota bacterium]